MIFDRCRDAAYALDGPRLRMASRISVSVAPLVAVEGPYAEKIV